MRGLWLVGSQKPHMERAAATLAARHRALTGRIADLRSLLAFVAAQHDIEAELAGGPRNVIDDVEHKLMNRTRSRAGAMSAIWLEPMLEAGVGDPLVGPVWPVSLFVVRVCESGGMMTGGRDAACRGS